MSKAIIEHISKSFQHHPLTLFSSLLVLTATFTIVAGFFVVTHNIENSFQSIGKNVQLSIYLDDSISPEDKSKLETQIKALEGFNEPIFTSKSQAAEHFKSSMSAYAPELLNEEYGNPLPASFEVALKAGVDPEDQLGLLKEASKSIESLIGVDAVSYGQDWVENYATVVRSFKVSSLLLLFVLFAGGMLIVSNSIKNSLEQRREEIEILELVGATSTEIRVPFIVEGAMIGVLSALGAVAITYLVFLSQSGLIQKELGFLGLGNGLQFLSPSKIILFSLFGLVLGALSSHLTVRNINTGWAASGAGSVNG
ncbi:MAG: hypothetical protein CL677_04225 [Bdellovibrionaceae bacterium]|nr:hypothetical protein [Pseudobdellovibrionaceae bacterium]|tara:strand:- start:63813 stop:64745 length:933 start_codon:yes stop_codon:yes gene_type:complete